MTDEESTSGFPFRPWVRSTCRRAMIWGVGVLAVVGAVAWVFRSPDEGAFGWAFGVLAGYGLLFWVSLLEIWWTAGGPAVEISDHDVAYQPLHGFAPRRVPFHRILACGPKEGTESLRLVVEGLRRDRELFLNLAVVRNKHRLLDELGERLAAAGLQRDGEGWLR